MMLNMFLIVLKYLLWFYTITIIFIASVIVVLKLLLEPKAGVCHCKTKLHGKTALVTGGNSGIGFETARDLARRGARVIIACRNVEKSQQSVQDIINTTGNEKVEFKPLDLCRFSSVKTFADDFNKNYDRLDILVNNSGCAGRPFKVSDDGIDLVMQTNHLGPFLLTNLLMDKLVASQPSRIVIVSSYMHNFAKLDLEDLTGLNTREHYLKYANSKLSNVLWMKALAKRLPKGVTANALHPGFVKTDIFKRLPLHWKKFIHFLTDFMFKDAKLGAQTSIHLCVCPDLNFVTGSYYKDCKPHRCHKLCDDEKFVDKFWVKCLSITGYNECSVSKNRVKA